MDVRDFDPGMPCWVDVSSPRTDVTCAFYEGLFGWEAEPMGATIESYTMFRLGGRSVAGCKPLADDDPGSAWTTYLSVTEVDAAVAAILSHGGRVHSPVVDVLDAGRMASVADPSGGKFALWEPGTLGGAELVNAPGSLCWNELTTRGADNLIAFYSAVFGWRVEYLEVAGAPFTYREIHVGDRRIAGCLEMDETWPEDLPTHWMAYFAVEDADTTAQRATAWGGSVSVEPFDLPVGRAAVIEDPTGAAFSVIALWGDAS